MTNLAKQRIKYLVEHGGLYPQDELVTRGYVARCICLVVALQIVSIAIPVIVVMS